MATDINIKIGATDTASAVFGKVARNAKKLGVGVDRIGQSFQRMGSFSSSAGAKLAATGGAITGAFAIATRTFAGFDDSMAAVSAKSGATGDSLERLRDLAKELGSTTKFSASEAASGMEFLAQAGFKTEQILSAIGPALSLAAAGGVELNEAADIASNVAAGFGLSADEFERVANVLARAATSANTDVLMMGETFTQSASIAKTAGQSIEETAAAMGILANSGVQASSAGTDLKNVLSRLAEGEVQDKLKTLGVTVKDASGEFLPMLDIMREFGRRTEDMAGPEKLAMAMDLFGKISGKSALILSDAGGEIDSMRQKMVDASVTAETMAATMQTGLGGLGTTIMSSLEGVQIAIGETFKEALTGTGDLLVNFLRGLTAWIEENQELVIGLGVAAVAVTGLGAALIATGASLSAFGLAMSGVSAMAATLGAAVAAALTPVGAILIGLTASVAYLGAAFVSTASETGLLSDAMEHAKKVMGSLLDVAKQTFSGINNALKSGDFALAAEIGMKGVEAAYWDGLLKISEAFNQMLPKIGETISSFFKWYVVQAERAAEIATMAITNPTAAVGEAAAFLAQGSGFEPSENGLAEWAISQRLAVEKELQSLIQKAEIKSQEIAKAAVPNVAEVPVEKVARIPKDVSDQVKKDIDEIANSIANISYPKPPPLFSAREKSVIEGLTQGNFGNRKQSIEVQATQSRFLTRGPSASVAEQIREGRRESKQQLEAIDKSIKVLQEIGRQGLDKTPVEFGVIA